MSVIVVTAPDPIVLPADIPGTHAEDDPVVTAMILAATEKIDGPTGWLGRAIGPQTLELVGSGFPCGDIELPFRPIIQIVSVKYLDADGVEQTVDASDYRLVDHVALTRAVGVSWPATGCFSDAVRIRYEAGYDSESTGTVPERARQAVILAVRHLMALTNTENVFLRSDQVVGIGSRQYEVSEEAASVIQKACESLLFGLKVRVL